MLKIINSPWSVPALLILSMALSGLNHRIDIVFGVAVFIGSFVWGLGTIQNIGHYIFSLFLAVIAGAIGGWLIGFGSIGLYIQLGWLGLLPVLSSIAASFLVMFHVQKRGWLEWIR